VAGTPVLRADVAGENRRAVGCNADLSISRPGLALGRDARKKGKELVRSHVKADEFASLFEAKSKDLFSIAALGGKRVGQPAIGKLNRLVNMPEEPGFHR
jgi:hypothetical protein